MVQGTTRDLAAEARQDRISHRTTSSRQHILSQSLGWLAVVASGVVSASALKGLLPPDWIGGLAAGAAFLGIADKAGKFAAKSSWHHVYEERLEKVINEFDTGNTTQQEFPGKLAEIRTQMDNTFP